MSTIFETNEYRIKGNENLPYEPTPTPSGGNPLFVDSSGYISIDYDNVDRRSNNGN